MSQLSFEKKSKMVFRRACRGFRFIATHESTAHKSAGRKRFDGQQSAAAAGRRDAARGVLRLSFQRNALAVVFARRADVVADRQRREGRPRESESVRLVER